MTSYIMQLTINEDEQYTYTIHIINATTILLLMPVYARHPPLSNTTRSPASTADNACPN